MQTIRIFLVDDHHVVRQGLRLFLDHHPYLHVCGEAGTLREALPSINQGKPHVVLMDYELPDGDGIIGCINIKAANPEIKVILLTAHEDEHIYLAARQAKMDGYLLKDIDGDDLTQRIIDIHSREQTDDLSSVASSTMDAANRMLKEAGLSPKEYQVLELLAVGMMNKEIAEELEIREKTVRNYVTSIFRKLHVTNRTEAAALWLRLHHLGSL